MEGSGTHTRNRLQLLGRQAVHSEPGFLELPPGARVRTCAEHHGQVSNIRVRVERHFRNEGVLEVEPRDITYADEHERQMARHFEQEKHAKAYCERVQQRVAQTEKELKLKKAEAAQQTLAAKARQQQLKEFNAKVARANSGKRSEQAARDQNCSSPGPRTSLPSAGAHHAASIRPPSSPPMPALAAELDAMHLGHHATGSWQRGAMEQQRGQWVQQAQQQQQQAQQWASQAAADQLHDDLRQADTDAVPDQAFIDFDDGGGGLAGGAIRRRSTTTVFTPAQSSRRTQDALPFSPALFSPSAQQPGIITHAAHGVGGRSGGRDEAQEGLYAHGVALAQQPALASECTFRTLVTGNGSPAATAAAAAAAGSSPGAGGWTSGSELGSPMQLPVVSLNSSPVQQSGPWSSPPPLATAGGKHLGPGAAAAAAAATPQAPGMLPQQPFVPAPSSAPQQAQPLPAPFNAPPPSCSAGARMRLLSHAARHATGAAPAAAPVQQQQQQQQQPAQAQAHGSPPAPLLSEQSSAYSLGYPSSHGEPRVVRAFSRSGELQQQEQVAAQAAAAVLPRGRGLPVRVCFRDTVGMQRIAKRVRELGVVLPPLCACSNVASPLDADYTRHCARNCAMCGRLDLHEQLLTSLLQSQGVL